MDTTTCTLTFSYMDASSCVFNDGTDNFDIIIESIDPYKPIHLIT